MKGAGWEERTGRQGDEETRRRGDEEKSRCVQREPEKPETLTRLESAGELQGNLYDPGDAGTS